MQNWEGCRRLDLVWLSRLPLGVGSFQPVLNPLPWVEGWDVHLHVDFEQLLVDVARLELWESLVLAPVGFLEGVQNHGVVPCWFELT